MAFVIADRVRETSTTTGTGNFTLAGAVDRFRTFDSVLDTGDTTYYTIADQSGVGWEVGIATFTSPSTLARTTILSSSNGGSAVDFGAGSKDVFITLPASRTVTSVDGGSTGLTPSTASYGAISLGGTLVAANGGTGQSSYTIGDLLYASGTTTLSKLADVATGNALISGGVGVAPSYGKIDLTTHVSGTLPIANGGTNGTTAATGFDNLAPTTTQGDIIYRSDTTNTRLAAGTTSQVLIGGTTPSWGAVTLTTMVSGILPVANGGTGTSTAFTTGSVVFAGASGVYSQNNSQIFWDNTNNRLGIGTAAPGSSLDVNGVIRDSKGNVRTIVQNAQTGAYVLVVGDAGKHISITTGGVTVNSGIFSAGDAISIYNNSTSNQTITQGGSVTMYLGGTATTGNRTLAQRGICTILCVASNTFVISGAGLS